MTDGREAMARAIGRVIWNVDINNYSDAGTVMPRQARKAVDEAITALYDAGYEVVSTMPVEVVGLNGISDTEALIVQNGKIVGKITNIGTADEETK